MRSLHQVLTKGAAATCGIGLAVAAGATCGAVIVPRGLLESSGSGGSSSCSLQSDHVSSNPPAIWPTQRLTADCAKGMPRTT